MTDDFSTLFESAKRASLLPHERSAMREELKLFMREHPARAPLMVRFLNIFSTDFSLVSYSYMRPAAVALVLVLCAGIGTSYAASGALPGDALYAVKIRVNEPVQGVLAVSDTAKANWNTNRAIRRLEEAEILAASGKLTAETGAVIQTELSAATKDFDANVAAVAKSTDPASVVDAQSNLEASLSAHAQVLVALSDVLPESQKELAPIIATVQVRAEGATKSRVQAERVLARANDSKHKKGTDARIAASAKKQQAENEVKDVQTLAVTASSTADMPIAVQAITSAFDAQQAVDVGNQQLNDGDYGGALNTYQAAIRTAQEVKVSVGARAHLQDHIQLPTFVGGSAAKTAALHVEEGSTTETHSTSSEEQ